MKKGWQIAPLGSLCTVRNGKSDTQDALESGEFVFFDRSKTIKRSSRFLFNCEALIIPGEGKEFLPRHFIGKFDLHQRAYALHDFVDNINVKYLYYYLHHRCDYLPSVAVGATVKSLRMRHFEEFPVAITAPDDQQRIVAILDEAFDGIATAKANAEKNLQNARALFESHLQSVFTARGDGWVEKRIGDACDLLNGFAFKSGDVVAESNTQLVRMGNLYGNQLDLERSAVFYPDNFAKDYARYLLNEGDLIMSLTGTTGKEDYGYTVRIPDCGHKLLMNQRIAKFSSIKTDVVISDYLLHYLRSRAFLDVLYPTANGTRQANLSSITIKTLPLPLCPILEQKKISSELDELIVETQRLESIYQQKLTALDDLKKSLLHQAFSGQL